jgi:hypothetical protein
MAKTTILLPVELRERARRFARQRRLSLGALLREALEDKIRDHPESWENDPLFEPVPLRGGSKAKAPLDLAENHDLYLCEAITKKTSKRRRR